MITLLIAHMQPTNQAANQPTKQHMNDQKNEKGTQALPNQGTNERATKPTNQTVNCNKDSTSIGLICVMQ